MSKFKSKFTSSRPFRKLRDVRNAVFPSEVRKGKRRSNSPSLSGEEHHQPFDSAVDSDEASTQPSMITPPARTSDEELVKTQSSRSSFPHPNAPPFGNNVEKVTHKKRQKAKLLRIHVRPRVGTWNERRGAAQEFGGQESPIMRDYTGARQRPESTCHCGGKCAAGSSGSSTRSPSSSLSPQRSGSTQDTRSETMQLPPSTPRSSSERLQTNGREIQNLPAACTNVTGGKINPGPRPYAPVRHWGRFGEGCIEANILSKRKPKLNEMNHWEHEVENENEISALRTAASFDLPPVTPSREEIMTLQAQSGSVYSASIYSQEGLEDIMSQPSFNSVLDAYLTLDQGDKPSHTRSYRDPKRLHEAGVVSLQKDEGKEGQPNTVEKGLCDIGMRTDAIMKDAVVMADTCSEAVERLQGMVRQARVIYLPKQHRKVWQGSLTMLGSDLTFCKTSDDVSRVADKLSQLALHMCHHSEDEQNQGLKHEVQEESQEQTAEQQSEKGESQAQTSDKQQPEVHVDKDLASSLSARLAKFQETWPKELQMQYAGGI